MDRTLKVDRGDGVEVTMELCSITPKMAAEWLELNVDNNRKLKRGALAKYATAMKEGRWLVSGESIKFDDSGRMFDGQHRLMAAVRSGCTFRSFVVRGVAASTIRVTDVGTKRTMADLLKFQGEVHISSLAATLGYCYRWSRGEFIHPMDVDNVTLLQFLGEHPELRDVQTEGKKIGRALGLPQAMIAAAIWWLRRIDEEDACDFFDKLQSPVGHEEDSPILLLREAAIVRDRNRRDNVKLASRHDNAYMLALLFKAWNYYRRGEPCKVLRWRKGGARAEDFPKPE